MTTGDLTGDYKTVRGYAGVEGMELNFYKHQLMGIKSTLVFQYTRGLI